MNMVFFPKPAPVIRHVFQLASVSLNKNFYYTILVACWDDLGKQILIHDLTQVYLLKLL